MKHIVSLFVCTAGVHAHFDPLQHLGGNSPYFAGPDVYTIDPEPPTGCAVDQVAFLSRHGSRYPDPSAYYQWTNLSAKIHAANFTTTSPELTFLHSWQPVVRHPDRELSQLSLGGYKELYEMGVDARWQYPDLYADGRPFVLWANLYQPNVPRVVDSARLFARGYLGPDATTLGRVFVVNSSDPRSLANSLAPSDLCPKYSDDGGGNFTTTWANIYLPPIVTRINGLLQGLAFNASDVSIFAYLCGFETEIQGRRSPWCDVFTADEIAAYEYAQDLRYWYGSGIGSPVGSTTMLPLLSAFVSHFQLGPNTTLHDRNGTRSPAPPLIATFSNDGQINQIVAATGIFDDHAALPADRILRTRTFKASHFVTMRGTVKLERLNCGTRGRFVRVKLNEAVYPIARCQTGPGASCEVATYAAMVAQKLADVGGFAKACGVANGSSASSGGAEAVSFLSDLGLPFEAPVAP